jgi:hypothetical protein
MQQSESEHILELSKELLDDIELGRISSEQMLLKCTRLARFTGSDEVREWLRLEMGGYNSTDPVSLAYMSRTGRWVDQEKKQGYWGPLAQQEASIDALRLKVQQMQVPHVGGDYANLAISNVINKMTEATNTISRLSGVRSRVLALMHDFVSRSYYERAFASMAQSVFERYKGEVDTVIGEKAGDVLEKIPSVVNRLAEGDEEAVSQALTTCRRIIEGFADAIYPPTDATVEIGGNQLTLDASKHLNRINAYIAEKTDSKSKRQRLRQNIANLYDRVSTGVHNNVPPTEAYALFLNVYLFLGEVLQLAQNSESQR